MILLSGKVGHRRLHGLCLGNQAEPFLFVSVSVLDKVQMSLQFYSQIVVNRQKRYSDEQILFLASGISWVL